MLVRTQKVVTETFTEDGGPPSPVSPLRGKYVHSFPATLLLQIPGTQHGLGTADLLLQAYTDDSPREALSATFSVNDATYDVVILFTQAQAGRVVLLA